MTIADLFNLKDRVAVVTGGYGLYGFNIAQALCEAGAVCVIAARNTDKCAEAAGRLRDGGYAAHAARLDQASEDSVVECIGETIKKFGRIDILVNNAVARRGLNLEDMSAEDWEEAQRVNATGLMLISRETVKHMRANAKGSIINISSIQGAVGPNFRVYGETGMSSPVNYTYDKWGMVGFTKWMANYYARYNIRVNCISPGGYNPELTKDDGNEFVKNYKRLTPLGRFADEDDIKGPVVFLASDASKYVTGQNLLVDGGWTSW